MLNYIYSFSNKHLIHVSQGFHIHIHLFSFYMLFSLDIIMTQSY